MNKIFMVFVVLSYLPLCFGKRDGVPPGGCIQMFPHHGYDAQNVNGDTPPFHITLDKQSYKKGDTITVELKVTEGNIQNADRFEGFLLQARSFNCEKTAIGLFSSYDAVSKPLLCLNAKTPNQHNSVTHIGKGDKFGMKVQWKNVEGGHIYFQATAVINFSTFWTNIISEPLYDEDIARTEFKTCVSRTKWRPGSNSSTTVVSSLFLMSVAFILSKIFF